MSWDVSKVNETGQVDLQRTTQKGKKSTTNTSVRNDTDRNIPQGTYIPGTPLHKKNRPPEVIARLQLAGTDQIPEAITRERIAAGDSEFYTVKPGDNIGYLALSCKNTNNYPGWKLDKIKKDICEMNGISCPPWPELQVGQKLRLPPPLANEETRVPMADPQD